MPSYQHIKVPAEGQKITVNADNSLNVPDQPIIPYHRGRRHRPRHHAGDAQGGRRGGGQGLRRQEEDPLDGGLRRREIDQGLWPRRLAARRNPACGARLRGLDQGPADHAGRRRHPLAERRAAPGTRPLRLPAPDPVLRRRAQPGQGAAQDQHGDLPRELGRHLRRHRVRGRERQGQEAHQVPAGRDGRQEDPLPEHLGHRHQAGVARRHRAPGAQGDPVRDRQRQAQRDDRAQGQHHEVHRRRLPRLGLCPGRQGVRRRADRRRPVDEVQESRRPARKSPSRTRSPTPSCSRSCCARPNTA